MGKDSDTLLGIVLGVLGLAAIVKILEKKCPYCGSSFHSGNICPTCGRDITNG